MVIMVLNANGQELLGQRERGTVRREYEEFWTPCEVVSSASCPAVIFSVPMTGVDPTKQKMIAKHSAWNGVSGYVKYTEWLLRGYYIFNSSFHFATQFLRFFGLLL
jgi:hypothetical protein